MRTDFVSRPHRLDERRLEQLWCELDGVEVPVVPIPDLVQIKKTNRDRDYAIIGELARRLEDPTEQLLASRSARNLAALAERHPDLVHALAARRPLLGRISDGIEATEAAPDAERRVLMRASESRLETYVAAAGPWSAVWPRVAERIEGLPLDEAHRVMVGAAEGVLPFAVQPAPRIDGDRDAR